MLFLQVLKLKEILFGLFHRSYYNKSTFINIYCHFFKNISFSSLAKFNWFQTIRNIVAIFYCYIDPGVRSGNFKQRVLTLLFC